MFHASSPALGTGKRAANCRTSKNPFPRAGGQKGVHAAGFVGNAIPRKPAPRDSHTTIPAGHQSTAPCGRAVLSLVARACRISRSSSEAVAHQERACGAVAEWSKAHAWKVCIRQKRIEGSNPSCSATLSSRSDVRALPRRGADGGGKLTASARLIAFPAQAPPRLTRGCGLPASAHSLTPPQLLTAKLQILSFAGG